MMGMHGIWWGGVCLFVYRNTHEQKKHNQSTQFSVLKIRDEVLYLGYWHIALSTGIELQEFVK
jgi:hypothetical protein